MAQLEDEIIEDERELREVQLEIEGLLLKEKVQIIREQAEILPIPSAIVQHGPTNMGKRTNCKYLWFLFYG